MTTNPLLDAVRMRTEPSANYRAVFFDGKTIRTPIDPQKPVTELRFPEFYDLSFGNRCGGGCPYCYAGASQNGRHYTGLVEKIRRFFGPMPLNRRPTQVAIGGEQEALENPEFWDAVRALHELQILPNFTTNGLPVDESIISDTLRYAGGVAVSTHPHLERHWRRAADLFASRGVRLNLHVIVSDRESIVRAAAVYDEYARTGRADYVVLLPYMNTGRAAAHPRKVDHESLAQWLDTTVADGKIAFGANLYPFVKLHNLRYRVSLYPPETMSKYLILDDPVRVYNNSFEKRPVPFTPEGGCAVGQSTSSNL